MVTINFDYISRYIHPNQTGKSIKANFPSHLIKFDNQEQNWIGYICNLVIL